MPRVPESIDFMGTTMKKTMAVLLTVVLGLGVMPLSFGQDAEKKKQTRAEKRAERRAEREQRREERREERQARRDAKHKKAEEQK
jgi:uncharacterized protein HemX